VIACVGLCLVLLGRWEVPSPVSASIGRSRDLTNQIGFVINPFYWIAAFSFIFTYLAGTAVYSVVVSSINAEVTRCWSKPLCLFFYHFIGSCIDGIPSQELHSSVSRSVRKGAALTGKGVLVPLSRGASTASWLSKAFQSGFPKLLERNLLLYRALILTSSKRCIQGLSRAQIHQIQSTRAFLWFTTEGWLSAKSMVRFQQIIYNNHWSLSTANSIASILLYSRSTQSSHSLVKWTISS
jgi:hypothetical protein